MKWLHFLISGIFIVFAIVQYNDPDPFLWIMMYLLVGAIPILYIMDKLNRKFLRILIITFVFTFLLYIPPIFQWISNGMPAIIGTPGAHSPMMEVLRESFGILLSCIVAIFYYRKTSIV